MAGGLHARSDTHANVRHPDLLRRGLPGARRARQPGLCPGTLERASRILRQYRALKLKVKCPHCGKEHEIAVREAYVDGVIRDVKGANAGASWMQAANSV